MRKINYLGVGTLLKGYKKGEIYYFHIISNRDINRQRIFEGFFFRSLSRL